MYLKVRRGESTQTFDFWMYGETKELKIGSGLRVGDDGVSSNHHLRPPKNHSSFTFPAGEYVIDAYARILNRGAPVLLSTGETLSFFRACDGVARPHKRSAFYLESRLTGLSRQCVRGST